MTLVSWVSKVHRAFTSRGLLAECQHRLAVSALGQTIFICGPGLDGGSASESREIALGRCAQGATCLRGRHDCPFGAVHIGEWIASAGRQPRNDIDQACGKWVPPSVHPAEAAGFDSTGDAHIDAACLCSCVYRTSASVDAAGGSQRCIDRTRLRVGCAFR